MKKLIISLFTFLIVLSQAFAQVHFSQLDSRWAERVMSPSTYRLRNAGCIEVDVAMTYAMSGVSVDPGSLHDWGVTRGMYTAGGLFVWSVGTAYDGAGGVQYIGAGTATPANLKAAIDVHRVAITYSRRGGTGHWVLVYSYDGTGVSMSDFKYLDPLDTSPTVRRAGDGLVVTGASTRILQRPTGNGSGQVIDNFQSGYADGYRQYGWQTVLGLGQGGSCRVTRNSGPQNGEDAWASWTFRSSVSSTYAFDAFITRARATTKSARYKIYRNGVLIYIASVNQLAVSDNWTRVYSTYVPAGWELKIVLVDVTGEANNTVDIVADAMRGTRL